MSIFRCSKCGCIENTAFSFHFNHFDDKQYLCSECDPEIGKWHGAFDKVSAEGYFFDETHYIYSPEEVDPDSKVWTYNRNFKMVGQVIDGEMRLFAEKNETEKKVAAIGPPKSALPLLVMAQEVFEYLPGYTNPNPLQSIFRDSPKKTTKCLLPDCDAQTSHNGGYCCAEHHKLHRAMGEG